MSWLLEALSALGAGQQLVMGATVLVVGFYLFKAVKIGKIIGDGLSSIAGYGIVLSVVGGVAIALGWIDPNVSAMVSQLSTAVDAVWSAVGEWVIDQTIGRLETSG
jgi:dipeptide/tripeptide permease